jgi:hypothetical protein
MAPRPKPCSECAVRDTALCRVLTTQQLARLNRRSYRRYYPAGQMIAGATATENWYATVLSGVVKLSKTLSDGRQQIVALLFPRDFIGRPYRAEFPTQPKPQWRCNCVATDERILKVSWRNNPPSSRFFWNAP